MTKKRNKRTPNGVAEVEKMLKALVVSKPKPKTNRRRKPRRSKRVDEEGMITLRRHELATSLKSDASGIVTADIAINPDSFSFLKGISKSFERTRWLKLHVYYKPAVAMTTGGLIAIGMDWDSATSPKDRAAVSAFTPSMHTPVWRDTSGTPMVIPSGKLQSRLWYSHHSKLVLEAQPGILRVVGNTSVNIDVGEIWVAYELQMQGTNPAS